MDVPRFRDLTAIFFRSGSFTLGGGNPIQAALHLELVERRRWLDSAEFALIYGLARFTPGTNVLACSAALAWRLGGWPAAIAAVVAVSVPASLLVLLLLTGYEQTRSNHWVGHAISGALVAVTHRQASEPLARRLPLPVPAQPRVAAHHAAGAAAASRPLWPPRLPPWRLAVGDDARELLF